MPKSPGSQPWYRGAGRFAEFREEGSIASRLAFKALTTRRSEFWDVSTVQPRHGKSRRGGCPPFRDLQPGSDVWLGPGQEVAGAVADLEFALGLPPPHLPATS